MARAFPNIFTFVPRAFIALVLGLPQRHSALCASPAAGVIRDTVPALLAKNRFYLHTFADIEGEHPSLAGCGLSLYALDVNARLEFHASRTTDLAAADLEVFAPYGLVEESMYPCM